jgi:hypothetical protein
MSQVPHDGGIRFTRIFIDGRLLKSCLRDDADRRIDERLVCVMSEY